MLISLADSEKEGGECVDENAFGTAELVEEERVGDYELLMIKVGWRCWWVGRATVGGEDGRLLVGRAGVVCGEDGRMLVGRTGDCWWVGRVTVGGEVC